MRKIKILFVCHGNICRSPIGEFVMKKLVRDAGKEKEFHIESRATHTDEIWGDHGSDIYPPAQKIMNEHGVKYEHREATLLRSDDYDKYDLFIGMDSENIHAMKRIFGTRIKEGDDKIHKLLEYTGSSSDVSDPWYTRDFETAYLDIYSGCKELLKALFPAG